MALSGYFQKYATSKFGLYCEWRGEQNIIGNYTDVTLDKYLSYSQLEVGKRADSVISINNESETYTVEAINDYSSGYKKKKLKSKTVRIYHDNNGKAENIPLLASWRFSGTYAGVSVQTITASESVTLDAIDRSEPVISASVTDATSSSVTFLAVSSTECDIWQYRINSGSWVQFSNELLTSKSHTIPGLGNNTVYTVEVRAFKTSNGVPGITVFNAKTLGGVTLNSVSSLEVDSAAPAITATYTTYSSEYSYRFEISKDSEVLFCLDTPARVPGTHETAISLSPSDGEVLLQKMPNSRSEFFELTLTALEGTEIRGTDRCVLKVYTTEKNSAPLFSGFNCYDSNRFTTDITGNEHYFIKGCSHPKIKMGSFSARSGSSIKAIETRWGTACASVVPTSIFGIPEFSNAGDTEITVTVVDSRGYTSSCTNTVKVADYEPPDIKKHSIKRVDNITETVHCIISGEFSPIIIDGEPKNTVSTVQYQYIIGSYSSGEWSEVKWLGGITMSGNTFTVDQTLPEPFDPQLKAFLQITVKDEISEETRTYVIYQGFPEVSIRHRKIGVDCSNPQRTLDVGGEIGMNGYNVLGFVCELSLDEDLNDITDTGYYNAFGGIADTKKNYPVSTVDGLIECLVVSSTEAIQRFYPYNNTGFYTRSKYKGEWLSWHGKIYM